MPEDPQREVVGKPSQAAATVGGCLAVFGTCALLCGGVPLLSGHGWFDALAASDGLPVGPLSIRLLVAECIAGAVLLGGGAALRWRFTPRLAPEARSSYRRIVHRANAVFIIAAIAAIVAALCWITTRWRP